MIVRRHASDPLRRQNGLTGDDRYIIGYGATRGPGGAIRATNPGNYPPGRARITERPAVRRRCAIRDVRVDDLVRRRRPPSVSSIWYVRGPSIRHSGGWAIPSREVAR